MKTVSVFGATGSVGRAACDILAAYPDRFTVACLVAGGRQIEELAARALALRPKTVIIHDPSGHGDLEDRLKGSGIIVQSGPDNVLEAARTQVDVALAAIVGMAGLPSLMAMMGHARVIAIANKEPLVAASPMVLEAAQQMGTTILPVDSEHNALFQVFDPLQRAALRRLVLTASGGPFRGKATRDLVDVTPDQALKHPTWSMGAKISIDSATLMNKGLEIIEACALFALEDHQVDVLIHPQSVVHGMAEYHDGSILCQMGPNDMRTPIIHAFGWPERLETPGGRLDLFTLARLDFEAADPALYPALPLARAAWRSGLAARIALNAANEMAVDAFLKGHLPFTGIIPMIERALESPIVARAVVRTLADVLSLDHAVRLETHPHVQAA